MTQPSILLEIDQGVALLTLNRPDNLNSFNVEMHERMRDAISTVRKDESVRVLVITGSGRGFCAGQDLSDRSVSPDQEMPDLGASLENTIAIGDGRIINQEGLRFPDEFVRHKMLDALGDLAVLGCPVRGHLEARCSGHEVMQGLVKKIAATASCYRRESFEAAP